MKRFRITRRTRHLAEDESGGTIAELAILVPFLIVMVGAVAELGRFFQTYSTLSKATRASSRYLSKVAYEENDKVKNLTSAKNVAVCGKTDCSGQNPVVTGLTTANIEITPDFPPGGEGNPITVKVSVINYNFQPLFNLGAFLGNETFSLALPIRPSTTMYYMWTEPAGGEEG
ncbi:MAG TPA: TadE/TadG family type IV pilus assembly protein [Pyrinomonadaceae bacterium]|nr:TadE/TadG family type IV pilus assembly protein [Pyrinomonadaceae bacterium]